MRPLTGWCVARGSRPICARVAEPRVCFRSRRASVLNDAGYWAQLVDAEWRYVFHSDVLRSTFADMGGALAGSAPLGSYFLDQQSMEFFALSRRAAFGV